MYNCEAVRNFDDMLGKVDGIISGGYYNYPWNHILHEPYLEAGLPNLINRPFANSLLKARKMIDTARKNGRVKNSIRKAWCSCFRQVPITLLFDLLLIE